ncbi:dopaminechrome tautomerase [Chironomus tepperi]|uniref:dopaminechrome tautomerase n=1 Tax=Chironomus tepperi TaxID=113505 RepID=UPI00391EE395
MILKELIRITTLVSLIINTNCVGEPPLEVIKQWTVSNFNFPHDWPSNDKNFYDPEKIVTTGFEIGSDRIFLATPRLFSGVPATISYVSRNTVGDSPVLKAYPDWSHHQSGLKQYNCSDIGLVSVYRLKIDSCNRLWAVDAGVSRSLEDFETTCPPKILIYDLNTNEVVRRIDFPKEVVRKDSLFTNIIIDETTSKPENNCDDAVVYISDTVEPALVVYDSGRDLTWRLSHPSMYADDAFATSRIGNDRFNLSDGVVGLAFDEESRTVYFQPLATDRLFSISTAALRAGPLPVGKELPVKLVGKKSSQGIGLGASPYGGDIFFAPFTETAIAQFNPRTNEQRILAYDYEALQFVADFKTTKHDPNAVYFVSSRFHRFFLKNVSPFEINTRILRIGNVAQPAPTYSFNPTGFHSIPNFGQNSLAPYTFQNVAPTSPSGYQFVNPSASPAAYSVLPAQKGSYSYSYNILPSQYPTTSDLYQTIPQPQPVPASYIPQTPSNSPLSFPPTSTSYNHPVTSFFKFRGSSPYAFERFGLNEKRGDYQYQQLNVGETLPHSGGSYVNINFDGGNYASDIYRPTRYLRNSSKNVTSLFQQ